MSSNTDRECEWCDGSFPVPESNPDQRFCDLVCANEATAPGFSGEDHPRWKGGVTTYRADALERDNHTCQRCGMGVGEGRTAHAHHLIPRAAGGPDAVGNCVTLCEGCHQWAHSEAFKRLPERHPNLLTKLREVVCEDAVVDSSPAEFLAVLETALADAEAALEEQDGDGLADALKAAENALADAQEVCHDDGHE